MTITPKNNVTINGIEYAANHTYQVNYTTFTKMVVAGAFASSKPVTTTTTADVVVDDPGSNEQPTKKSFRRRTTKTK